MGIVGIFSIGFSPVVVIFFSYPMKISYRKLAVANFHTAELLKLTTYENKLQCGINL
jgi:hypothetical protein